MIVVNPFLHRKKWRLMSPKPAQDHIPDQWLTELGLELSLLAPNSMQWMMERGCWLLIAWQGMVTPCLWSSCKSSEVPGSRGGFGELATPVAADLQALP